MTAAATACHRQFHQTEWSACQSNHSIDPQSAETAVLICDGGHEKHSNADQAIAMYSRNALDSVSINSRSASLTTLILVKSEELLSGVLVALET